MASCSKGLTHNMAITPIASHLNKNIYEMKLRAKLIHKTYASYLPTAFPAHYYGMPNGKIFLVFSRFYEVAFGKSGLEFVFAEHNDFSYDYKSETIISACKKKKNTPIFAEHIDSPRAKINIFKINRDLQSYGEAQVFLNSEAIKMKNFA